MNTKRTVNSILTLIAVGSLALNGDSGTTKTGESPEGNTLPKSGEVTDASCPSEVTIHSYGEIAKFGPDGSFQIEQYPIDTEFTCAQWAEPEGCHTVAGITRYDRNPDGSVQTNPEGRPYGHPLFPSCKERP